MGITSFYCVLAGDAVEEEDLRWISAGVGAHQLLARQSLEVDGLFLFLFLFVKYQYH
jgi:hypothetical protein